MQFIAVDRPCPGCMLRHFVEADSARVLPKEVSLLTGETRSSNAVARSRVDCYRLDKPGLQGIITRRLDLAEDISAAVAHRETELAAGREGFSA